LPISKDKRNIASCPIIWSQRNAGYWIFLSFILNEKKEQSSAALFSFQHNQLLFSSKGIMKLFLSHVLITQCTYFTTADGRAVSTK
jgi:hypothetical protein